MSREGSGLRIADRRKAEFNRHILPTLGQRPIADIKRSEIVRLLDHIEDTCGPAAAHATLAHLSKLFNWYAARDDEFRSPIVRGMGRIKPSESARDRVLTDAELRAIWSATAEGGGAHGPFNRYVRFLLLTATRKNEAAEATRAEIAGDVWTIPAERYKGGRDHVVPLCRAAIGIIHPPIDDAYVQGSSYSDVYLFGAPITSFSRHKAELDAAAGVSGWRLHDLRRTARSLMSRAGVSADIAERCLDHVLPGIRATYDRHSYTEEKRAAFEALAQLVGEIVGPSGN
jgi:integrase